MTLLKPIITQNFNGTIWRLEVDELTDTMVIEVRNEQDKQTSFASLNIQTGEIYFTDYKPHERWLTGVECVYDNVVLLHQYRHESGPEHKAIIAVDAVTGHDLWSNYSLAFDHLSVNGPVVYNTSFQPKKLLLADIKTGLTNNGYNAAVNKPLDNSIVIPGITSPEHFVPGSLPTEPYGNIVHYLDHNKYRIVSLHALENGQLQQLLFVFEGTDVIYSDLLNSAIQKLQPEAFVLHKNALIYIKNRNEIKVLSL
jgi:hypothetical protein